MRRRWILAHVIAGSLVGPLLYLVVLLAYVDLQNRFGRIHVPITLVIGGVLSGTLLAVAQGIALRPYLRSAGWWTLVTALLVSAALPGMTIAMIASARSSDPYAVEPAQSGGWEILAGMLAPIAFSFMIAAGQWLILRRSALGAIWWIPAAGVGFLLAVILLVSGIGVALILPVPRGGPNLVIAEVICGAVGGLLYAAITGAVLTRVLPVSDASKPGKADACL